MFEKFHAERVKISGEDCSNGEFSLLEQLHSIKSEPVQDLSTDVFVWWKVNGHRYRLLEKLTNAIFGVPVSQVSVERAFNDLNLVFGQKRTKMDKKVLSALLFLRINRRFQK